MRGILQALQVIGSVLSTKMTGDTSKHIRFVLLTLLVLTILGFYMQVPGDQP